MMSTHIGENIKNLRAEKGLSIRELASKSGISISQISKIETGKVDTTIMNLMRLAAALDVVPSRIIDRKRDEARPVRKGEGYQIRRQAASNPNVVEIFLHIEKNAQMQPELLILPPGGDSGKALTHDGDEFCYVLEGKVRLFLEPAEHVLDEGDLIYFDNRIPHRWQNENEDCACKLLLCCSPPVLR